MYKGSFKTPMKN